MTLRDLEWLSPFTLDRAPAALPGGHTHFWERAMSRRSMFGAVGGAAAAAAVGSALKPIVAWADEPADPRPIPGGIVAGGLGWHVNGPGYSSPGTLAEQSSITDFSGDIACAIVRGTGVGRQGPAVTAFPFDSDMRFMKGRYVGMDGRMHTGTFGFI